MLRSFALPACLFCLLLLPGLLLAQANPLKNVTIVVRDASTNQPVEGAEVIYKGMLAKQKKKTNAEGKATFQIFIVANSVALNFEVKDSNPQRPHKTITTSFTVQQNQDVYEFSTTVQPETRQLKFKINDDKQQPIVNAKATLMDDKSNALFSSTDATGTASFEAAPGTFQSSAATLTLEKEGFTKYVMPVGLSDAAALVTITAPLQTSKPGGGTMLEPTGGLIPTALPTNYIAKNPNPPPVWGPYQPGCAANPLADVPEYSPFWVQDEKDLLDNISSACVGSAGEAVDALTDILLNVESVTSKLHALWKTNNLQQAAQTVVAAKKLAEDNAEVLAKSGQEAIKKTKDLLENMQKLVAGPGLYAAGCLWEGIKTYATEQLPADLQKVVKGTEGFMKAKEAMTEKLQGLQKWYDAGAKKPSSEERKLFTEWKDISEGVQGSADALGILVSYVSDPKKMLPYETQMSLALGGLDEMKTTLLTDCQIRAYDLRLREGIAAGQQALTAARKLAAQKRKGELKWKEIVYQATKNYDWMELNYDPGYRGWDTWKKYQLERYAAEKRVEAITAKLVQFTPYCEQLQPLAATINERVNKYERLYGSGLDALSNCKLDAAADIVRQLKKLEESECGHFFPRPYGTTKSEALQEKIRKASAPGICAEMPKGAYVLKRTEVTESNDYYKITESEYKYVQKDGTGYSFSMLIRPPAALDPGSKFLLDFTAASNDPKSALDFSTHITWESERSNREPGNSDGWIVIGNKDGKFIPSATGTVSLSAPDTNGSNLMIMNVRIAAAQGMSMYGWVKFIYEKK
jgi:hypothetical protein